MQRCQLDGFSDNLSYRLGDDRRSGELFAAVYDAMAHSLDLVEAVQCTGLRRAQNIEDFLQGLLVLHHAFDVLARAGRAIVGHRGILPAQPFYQRARQRLFRVGPDKLALDGGTAAVDDQYDHACGSYCVPVYVEPDAQ